MTARKQAKKPSPLKEVDLAHLVPPPAPWNELASIGTLYLLGDVDRLCVDVVESFIRAHPVITVRLEPSKFVVVGQFRSWELALAHHAHAPDRFGRVPAIQVEADQDQISALAARNLLLESLLLSLAPEVMAPRLAHIWEMLPPDIASGLFPDVHTQSGFSDLIGYSSRTGFDPRRMNALAKPAPASPSHQGTDNSAPSPVTSPPHSDGVA